MWIMPLVPACQYNIQTTHRGFCGGSEILQHNERFFMSFYVQYGGVWWGEWYEMEYFGVLSKLYKILALGLYDPDEGA